MQRTVRAMLAGVAAAAAIAGTTQAVHAATCGDSNNNGSLGIDDVVGHLRVVSGIDPAAGICGGAGYNNCADLNGNGVGPTDISDTTLLLRRASGIPSCDPDTCLTQTIITDGGSLTSPITGNVRVADNAGVTFTGLVFVNSGGVLTVGKGATLKGIVGDPPATIIVKPGGRINAVGTSGQPITVTSNNAPGTRNKEDIGGVAILGRAPVNEPDVTLEGLTPAPDTIYGGTNTNDFSGCVSYLRVQFAGRDLTPDNELNNFVMAGVGRATQVDHVQGHFGADDCLEWFGGTVNTKYMVASACGDDGFDTQLGTRGGLQFGLMAQYAPNVEAGGSNGLEMDNSEFGFDNEPRSNPKYCNITVLGAKGQAGAPATNQVGVFSRRGNAMTIANAIVKDFNEAGYQLRDPETSQRACVNEAAPALNTTAPAGVIQNSLFNDNGPSGAVHAKDHSSCPSGTPNSCICSSTEHFPLLAAKNTIGTADAAVDAIGGGTFPPASLVPAAGSLPDTHPAADCTAIDSSFVAAPYVGAFAPGGTNWTSGWTAYPLN